MGSEEGPSQDASPVGMIVRKRATRPQNLRKRPATTGEDETDVVPPVARRTRVEDIDEETTKASNEGLEKLEIFFSPTGTALPLASGDMGATAAAEYDLDLTQDHRARREARLAISQTKATAVEVLGGGSYKGLSAYRSYLEVRDTSKGNAASDKNRVAGPVRAQAHIRTTCRFDFAPDLCKDYNETGFCGFGDSCKFVHDRGDYKSGWELEQEWEASRHVKPDEEQFLIESSEADVAEKPKAEPPSECLICSKDFTPPIVVTRCAHYFCERCALGAAKKSPRCPVCTHFINGQFTVYKKK